MSLITPKHVDYDHTNNDPSFELVALWGMKTKYSNGPSANGIREKYSTLNPLTKEKWITLRYHSIFFPLLDHCQIFQRK